MADKKPSLAHRVVHKLKENNERGARKNILEDLFNDFNRSRAAIYKMNFFRGIFLGAGTVIGGTVVIALLVWLLSQLGHVFPALGHFFDSIAHLLEGAKK